MTDQADYDTVAEFATDAEARQAVETLILEGVGATWEPVGTRDGVVDPSSFRVLVVPVDLPKASRVLGLPEPDVVDDEGEEPLIPEWVYVVAIVGAAMIIIPLIAFFVSFKISGG
jgi:hypothetical protein